jgi:hypothetical protein
LAERLQSVLTELRRNPEMFRNVGQKFVNYTPLEQTNNVAENAQPAPQEDITFPDLQNPVQPQAQDTSIRPEMQIGGMIWKTLLNKNLERQLSKPELPLQKDESSALEKVKDLFKPAATEVFTGSGDDQVEINMGPDNLIHVKVNGSEVWSGTEYQFKKLKIDTGDGDDHVVNTVNAAEIFTGSGDDIVINVASRANINTGAGYDKVNSRGNYNNILTGRGNDSVENKGESNRIDTDSGNDVVHSLGDNNDLLVGDGSNSVETHGEDNFVLGDRGDDNVAVYGDDNIIFLGDGDNIVHGSGDRNRVEFGQEGASDGSGLVGNKNTLNGYEQK